MFILHCSKHFSTINELNLHHNPVMVSFVSTRIGRKVPRGLVKYYSRCVCQGVCG